MYKTCELIYSILKVEFLNYEKLTKMTFEDEIEWSQHFGLLRVDETQPDEIILNHSYDKIAFHKFHFIKNLLQSYVDSYYIVLTTLDEIMAKGLVLEKSHIVFDLHKATQEIYYQGAINFMNSSLVETLSNAFVRFSHLGLCDIKSYEESEGPPIDYIECPIQRKPLLEKYIGILEGISSCANNPEKIKQVERETRWCLKAQYKL